MDNVSCIYSVCEGAREKKKKIQSFKMMPPPRACHEKFARLYFHLFICVYRIVYMIECVGEMPKGCKIQSWKMNEGKEDGKINNVHPFCSLVRPALHASV